MFTIGPPLWGSAGGDPSFSSVVLLTHFNGNLIDVCGNALAADGTSFTSTNAKFTQSLSCDGTSPGGGGSNVVYSTGTSTNWDMGTSDFTIEGWMWFNNTPTRPRTLIRIADDTSTAGASEFQIFNDGGGRTYFMLYPTAAATVNAQNSSVSQVNNAWTHLAMTRQSDTYRLFVNGTLGTTGTSSYRRGAGVKKLFIGNSHRAFVDGHDGLLDDIRITRGVARYTATFTTPTAPFADS
jgi:hypothetical protein